MTTKEIILANPDKSSTEIAKIAGVASRTIRKIRQQMGIDSPTANPKPNIDPEKQFELDMEKLRLNFSTKKVDQKYQVAMKQLVELREYVSEVIEVKDRISTYQIKPTKKGLRGEATAVAIASDWHVDEQVKAESVDGTNEYNMRIAKKRAEKFFQSTLKLVQKEQQDVTIKTLVLALIGDFISGHIHPELMETTEVSPQDAMLYAMNLIASGIEYLLDNSDLEIIVPCSVGNHARDTHKVNIATEHGNNKEWAMYNFLAMYFSKEKRVKFVMPRSQFTYIDIYEFTIRFIHGHLGYKFGGGIGGIAVPLNKAVMRWNESKKAYLTVLGHWHQRQTSPSWVINGSLIGDAPYGKVLGFSGKPEQAFFLIEKGVGKTVEAPIHVI